jgi:hypothetical protein
MTFGRTVAICGRVNSHRIVAMTLPPKAGRVCSSSLLSGLIVSSVQSAVRPALMRAATRDARSRPMLDAPISTISGLCWLIRPGQHVREGLRAVALERRVLDQVDAVGAVACRALGEVLDLVADEHHGDVGAELLGELAALADQLGGHHREPALRW